MKAYRSALGEQFMLDATQPQTLGDYVAGKYNLPGSGYKLDTGKPRYDLIPFDLLDGEQKVWEFGARKYTAFNWRKGMPLSQPYNALLRHLFAYMGGEDNDPESGLSHLDHAACCLRMMQNTAKYYPQHDDRSKDAIPKTNGPTTAGLPEKGWIGYEAAHPVGEAWGSLKAGR